MTRVNFYILQSDTNEAFYDFSCRLIEKAVRQGNKVLLYMDNQQEAEKIDEVLWQFKPESYLPHAIDGSSEAEDKNLPVLISPNELPAHHQDLLINLSTNIPQDFARFKRFAQVVNQAPEKLKSSREHFAFFKDRGYPIEVNKLDR